MGASTLVKIFAIPVLSWEKNIRFRYNLFSARSKLYNLDILFVINFLSVCNLLYTVFVGKESSGVHVCV